MHRQLVVEDIMPAELNFAQELMRREISAKILLPPRELDAYVAQLLATYMKPPVRGV